MNRSVLAHLFDLAALAIAKQSTDSDAYLIQKLFPVLSEKLEAAAGLVGCTVLEPLAVKQTSIQLLEGKLQSKAGTKLSIIVQGSYAKAKDGEWLVILQAVDNPANFNEDHSALEWDVRKDATSLLKCTIRLLEREAHDAVKSI